MIRSDLFIYGWVLKLWMGLEVVEQLRKTTQVQTFSFKAPGMYWRLVVQIAQEYLKIYVNILGITSLESVLIENCDSQVGNGAPWHSQPKPPQNCL